MAPDDCPELFVSDGNPIDVMAVTLASFLQLMLSDYQEKQLLIKMCEMACQK